MNYFRIKYYEIYSEKIKDEKGVRFAFITDMHGLMFGENNQNVRAAVDAVSPEAVLITGDMNVRTKPETLKTSADVVLALAEKYPVYYALGNHEYKMSLSEEYGEAYREYERILTDGGVHFLHNEKARLSAGGADFWLHGLELPLLYYQKPRSPKLTMETMETLVGEPYEEGVHILLAHNPKYGKTYFSWGADLILSGHYHGGVLRLGENRGLTCPQFLLFPPFCCGDFKRGTQHMIVSAGMGEHTIPVRIHNPRELLVITLMPLENSGQSI